MSALTIRLPNSVHQKIKELAERDQISVNQFIASAAAEKMASVLTLDYLKAEAAQGDRAAFERFLGRVPDAPAAQGDEAVAGALLNPVQDRAREQN
jgi:predicted transcriptional regulator